MYAKQFSKPLNEIAQIYGQIQTAIVGTERVKVALVGATGSDKTTVTNLLVRFYDIEHGKITVNGQDISKVASNSIRNNIGVVLQDAMLFSDTVENNLKYANENAVLEDLEKALEQSQCLERVHNFKEGF